MASASGAGPLEESEVTGQAGGAGQRVTRRRIYLQRLVGDNVMTPKKVSSRRASTTVVLRFVCYLVVATVVILNRTSVGVLFQMNSGIETALKGTSFTVGSERKYFVNISTADEISAWLRQVLLHKIMGSGQSQNFRRNLTLLSYNRVVPSQGVCSQSASVTVTLRRAQTTTNNKSTTTSRFQSLYPRAWVGSGVDAGSATSEAEAKDHLAGPKQSSGKQTFWKHSSGAVGYNAQGGHVAVVTLQEQQGTTFFHLMDYDADPHVNAAEGVCGDGLRRGATLTEEQFSQQGFFDDSFASLAIAFVVYNANLQTLSRVSVIFNANYAGRIVQGSLSSETICLDIYSSSMRYFDMIYLVSSFAYLIDWCWQLRKRFPTACLEAGVWINLLSIVMSLTSLLLWYIYTPYLTGVLRGDNLISEPNEIKVRYEMLKLYKQATAIAALTIYLRLIHYLATIRARVDLLERTLRMSAGNIAIYLAYVLVIFWGFAAFAQMHFSAFSPSFINPWVCLLTCFQMFFGQIDAMETVDGRVAVLKSVFYVPFMVFFYFISVQMFNAIVNYAYNRVSEEMEPQFEHERIAEKRRAMQLKAGGHKSLVQQLKERCLRHVFQQEAKPGAKEKEEAEAAKKAAAKAAPQFDNLDADVKAKVENYLNRDRNAKAQDGVFNVIMFLIFVVSYIWFLAANLTVNDNLQIWRAVNTIVEGTPIVTEGRLEHWSDISTLPEAAAWVESSLPVILFNTTGPETQARAMAAGLYEGTAVCIKTWNCLVQMQEHNTTEIPKLLRITQRRARILRNEGRVGPDTPDDFRFMGGMDAATGLYMSEALVPLRSAAPVNPFDAPGGDNEDPGGLRLDPALKSFCSVVHEGETTSFKAHGGMMCVLDADYASFASQIKLMLNHQFFSPDTSAWVIEFAMQNSNQELLSHVTISFQVLPSGVVQKEVQVQSLKLFDLYDFLNNYDDVLLRLVPGLLYLILTLRLIKQLYGDLRKDQYRRKLNDGVGPIWAAWKFFRHDLFNTLEAGSIFISIFSGVLFIIWLVQDARVQKYQEGNKLSDFLSYLDALTDQAVLYNRLSALNALLMAVRPLKFVRENQRVAKLNQTLYEAAQDITWFVVILFVTVIGFMMFAHIAFGPYLSGCSTIFSTLVYCFRFLLGDFDFVPLIRVDWLMATFMFPYLIIVYCVFTSIFFAIIDRYFITADPPPIQWKRKLKPVLQRVCRCIEWDEDYVMEQDPNAEKKEGPPSRRVRVQMTQQQIQDIKMSTAEAIMSAGTFRSQDVSEVCDMDEHMEEALHWSKEEAKRLVSQFGKLHARKQGDKNDEHFIKNEVMGSYVRTAIQTTKAEMEEAGRNMRYATQVHEQVALSEQETLARYILLLERKIQRHLAERNQVKHEVEHLKNQSEKMRLDTHERLQQQHALAEVGFLDIPASEAAAAGSAAAAAPREGTSRFALASRMDSGSDEDAAGKASHGALSASRATEEQQMGAGYSDAVAAPDDRRAPRAGSAAAATATARQALNEALRSHRMRRPSS